MEEIKIRELPEKSYIDPTDKIIIEDNDGTKLAEVKSLQTNISGSIFFNNVEDMKSADLHTGDRCITLGYRTPNDGGSGTYMIEYDPGSVEDGGLIHYLNTSDTLRAKLVHNQKVNVDQFGATGDGSSNDYSFIQAALNTGLPVEFTSGKRYRINNPLLFKNNQTVNFNWATIVPYNCEALSISGNDRSLDFISNVVINNINIDCSNNGGALSMYLMDNININNINVENISGINKAVNILSGDGFKISNASFNSISGSGIGIDFGNNISADTETRAVLSNIKFYNLEKAFQFSSSSDIIRSISMDNIHIENDTLKDNTYVYYFNGYGRSIKASNIKTKNISQLVYAASNSHGDIELTNINTLHAKSVYDILSTDFDITLTGNHHYDGNQNNGKKNCVIERLYGTLYVDTNYFNINTGTYDNIKTSLLPGKLFDNSNAIAGETEIITSGTTTLINKYFTNKSIDWKTSSDLQNIDGGIEGQILYIFSSNKKNIKSSSKIALADNVSTIQLSSTNGVCLKYKNNKWTQVIVDERPTGLDNDQETTINNAVTKNMVNAPNGVAGLDSEGKIYMSQVDTSSITISTTNITQDSTHRFMQDTAKATTNWNTCTTNGWYYSETGASNAPVSGYLVGQVTASPKEIVQEVYYTDNNREPVQYNRTRLNNTWSSWKNVSETTTVESVSLSDDYTSNNSNIALSTAGSNSLYNNLNTNLKKYSDDADNNVKKYADNADTTVKQYVSDNYLNIKNGGTVQKRVTLNEGFSVGSKITAKPSTGKTGLVRLDFVKNASTPDSSFRMEYYRKGDTRSTSVFAHFTDGVVDLFTNDWMDQDMFILDITGYSSSNPSYIIGFKNRSDDDYVEILDIKISPYNADSIAKFTILNQGVDTFKQLNDDGFNIIERPSSSSEVQNMYPVWAYKTIWQELPYAEYDADGIGEYVKPYSDLNTNKLYYKREGQNVFIQGCINVFASSSLTNNPLDDNGNCSVGNLNGHLLNRKIGGNPELMPAYRDAVFACPAGSNGASFVTRVKKSTGELIIEQYKDRNGNKVSSLDNTCLFIDVMYMTKSVRLITYEYSS